jgi:hypothetical protein
VLIVIANHTDPLNHAWHYGTTLALRCQGATFFQWSLLLLFHLYDR